MSVFYRLHQDLMWDSKCVKLDGFGSFKIGITSNGLLIFLCLHKPLVLETWLRCRDGYSGCR